MRLVHALVVVAGVAAGSAMLSAQGPEFGAGVPRPGQGITNPRELKFAEPMYPQAALDSRVQGMVVLEAIVLANGTVGDVRVLQSLDAKYTVNYGLDQAAVNAAKSWLFHPAMKNGQAVPIIVTLEMMFRPPAPAAAVVVPGEPVRLAVVSRPPQDRLKLPDDGFAAGARAEDTPGLVRPKTKYHVEPKYTSNAMRAKIQGVVVVEAVIGIDGTVTKARVFESLDKVYGLDDEAVAAIKRFTFEPGVLAGEKVPVYARFELLFRLH